ILTPGFRRSRRRRPIGLLLCFCLLGIAGVGLYHFRDSLSRFRTKAAQQWSSSQAADQENEGEGGKQIPSGTLFPRRALAVSINNYLYANPIGYGAPGRKVHTLLDKLANVLHIQPDQVLELSDFTSVRLAQRSDRAAEYDAESDKPVLASESFPALP